MLSEFQNTDALSTYHLIVVSPFGDVGTQKASKHGIRKRWGIPRYVWWCVDASACCYKCWSWGFTFADFLIISHITAPICTLTPFCTSFSSQPCVIALSVIEQACPLCRGYIRIAAIAIMFSRIRIDSLWFRFVLLKQTLQCCISLGLMADKEALILRAWFLWRKPVFVVKCSPARF